jgi:hypothetical protein
MFDQHPHDQKMAVHRSALKFLKPNDIILLERALEKAGPCCELHLIVEKGQLRYISLLQMDSNGMGGEDIPK